MPSTLLDWLLNRFPTAKRQTLRRMVNDGRVLVNDIKPRSLKMPIGAKDRVEVREHHRRRKDATAAVAADTPNLHIVHEDDDLLVVNKPAGLLTSTVPREPRPTLLAAVRAHVAAREPRARVGLIHRLDRDASGLLVFSKNDAAYQSLKSQFFHHTVQREYLAVTSGVPNPREATIESRLEERADGTVYSTRQAGKGERAVTHYKVLETSEGRALVRVRLETGRKHQIRVHLAERGTPIVGDPVYGKTPAPQMLLIAVTLAFAHPRSGKHVKFELEKPKRFAV